MKPASNRQPGLLPDLEDDKRLVKEQGADKVKRMVDLLV